MAPNSLGELSYAGYHIVQLQFFSFLQFIKKPTAHSGTTVNQLLRRAAAVALRRERNNSNQSDDFSQKRHRIDNGILGNNNSPDVINHMPQITATDFSTIKHNNNNTPPLKENDRNDNGMDDEWDENLEGRNII